MGQVIKIPEQVDIGHIMGKCTACGDEIIITNFYDDGDWYGTCCGCAQNSCWFLNEENQWDHSTYDEDDDEDAPVVELYPKEA